MDFDQLLENKINHFGYIVEDIPRAVGHWARLGVGPFYGFEHLEFDLIVRTDGPCVFDHSAAFAWLGDVGVELHQIHRAEPLGFAHELGCGRGNGLNHIAYVLEDPELAADRLIQSGYPQTVYCKAGPIEDRMHYIAEFGHLVELHQASDAISEFWAEIAEGARTWDGTDPLRSIESPA